MAAQKHMDFMIQMVEEYGFFDDIEKETDKD